MIILTKEEAFLIEAILHESEADEALEYLKKVIAPKIKKEITCLKIGGK